MKLTKEEQDILDGKKGEVLAKVMKTKGEPPWSVLGSAIGMKVTEEVPYIAGIDKYHHQVDNISMGKLKDMGWGAIRVNDWKFYYSIQDA